MSREREKFFRDYMAAWNSHVWDKVAPFFPDDCVYESAASGTAFHGKQEMKAYFEGTVLWSSDFKLEIKSVFHSGDWLANEWTMSGTHTGDTPGLKATGKRYSIQGASIMEFRNGKLHRHTDYWSLYVWLQQVGIIPG